MATSRLPFVYPNLLRAVRSCEPTTYRSIRHPPQRGRGAGFHTCQPYEHTAIHHRYGQATDPNSYPLPWPKDKPVPPPPERPPKEVTKRQAPRDDQPGSGEQSQDSASSSKQQASQPDEIASSAPEACESPTNIAAELPSQQESGDNSSLEATSEAASSETSQSKQADSSSDGLVSLFEVPDGDAKSSDSGSSSSSSSSAGSESQKHPHLAPPPYVHHFDTYGLVKDLGKGGFSDQQAIQIMKATRGLLADNLEVAKKGLYSKSDFENESYLFRAACSELRNSLQTSRNADIQAQRSRRAQLQHEADILSQRLNQELTGLNDNLKEMFNEQKIWTRELQRSVDTNIQELNYKITVSLHSDGKSEVESLRWILTRRAAIAIATSAGEFHIKLCANRDKTNLTSMI